MMAQALLDERCRIADPSGIATPAVAVCPAMIEENLLASIAMLPGPERLRPHVKTHKTIELTKLELKAGVAKHKCATISEAELLAEAGAKDVLLAYPLVGPNIQRFVDLLARFGAVRFSAIVDHPGPLAALGRALSAAGRSADVLLDLDVGHGRTGIEVGPDAVDLYRRIGSTPGVVAGGLHVYDGHVKDPDPQQRTASVESSWRQVGRFLEAVAGAVPIPRIVGGGSPSFPAWARLAAKDDRIECSPGTFFLNDWGYYRQYEDLPLRPAAVVLTRLVSKPARNRLTLDAGTKSVASDPPIERRVRLLGLDDAKILWQNEEHLVIESADADRYEPGDLFYAWPGHICPTCALHRELLVIEDNKVVGSWPVLARDRRIHC